MVELVVYAVMAAFIFFRLYNSLGKASDLNLRTIKNVREDNNEVILIKEDNKFEEQDEGVPSTIDAKKFDEVKLAIKNMTEKDKDFSLKRFLHSSAVAFEYIITSFSKGNKLVLKSLLDNNLYNIFVTELDNRTRLSEFHEDIVVCIKSQEILDIRLEKGIAYIAVRFITDQINFVKNKDGEVISGSISQINRLEDLWLFKRNINSNDHRWYLTSSDYKVDFVS